MNIFSLILIVLGLCVFEIINSIDNAVINAEVLSTMQPKYRKWFLSWGLIFAVMILRGLLPFLLVIITTPESSAHLLLISGGTFLVFLFFHWLFMEPKNYGLRTEPFFQKQGVWFYAVVSIFLSTLVLVSSGICSS